VATIRRARPDDVRFLAWVILAATRSHRSRSFFDLLLPDSDEERTRLIEELVLQEKPSWWHWSLFWIALQGSEPAAALSGFDPQRLVAANDAVPAALAARSIGGERLAAGLARCAPMFTCFHQPTPGAWVVESVATRPEARGAGLAHALVEHVLAEGPRWRLRDVAADDHDRQHARAARLREPRVPHQRRETKRRLRGGDRLARSRADDLQASLVASPGVLPECLVEPRVLRERADARR